MAKDGYWACARLDKNGFIREQYLEAVEDYIIFAIKEQWFVSGDRIRCPCLKCQKHPFLKHDDVRRHLYYGGFCYEPTSGVGQLSRSKKKDIEQLFDVEIENPNATMVRDTEEASYSACNPRTEYPPSLTEVNHLREEIMVVKDKLQNLEQSQQSLVQATNEIKARFFQITQMLTPGMLFQNASIGPSQPICDDKDQEEESNDSDDED